MLLQEILSKSEADPTRGVETLLAKAAGLNDISSVLGTTGSEQSKEERELYIGNVPANVTNAQFVDFLNRTIEYLHLNTAKGGPVINAWISVEGQYVESLFSHSMTHYTHARTQVRICSASLD